MQDKFLRKVQEFIANGFGVGTIRNMEPKGTIKHIRLFLKEIDLAAISKMDATRFALVLDDHTEKLKRCMPGGGHWGVARKCMNLFLRDALYNVYLREAYDLTKFEKYLEVPLDSNVGNRLRGEKEGKSLPRWKTVKHLQKSDSNKFQEVAAQVGKRKGIERVHLDIYYWRDETMVIGNALLQTSRQELTRPTQWATTHVTTSSGDNVARTASGRTSAASY